LREKRGDTYVWRGESRQNEDEPFPKGERGKLVNVERQKREAGPGGGKKKNDLYKKGGKGGRSCVILRGKKWDAAGRREPDRDAPSQKKKEKKGGGVPITSSEGKGKRIRIGMITRKGSPKQGERIPLNVRQKKRKTHSSVNQKTTRAVIKNEPPRRGKENPQTEAEMARLTACE